MRFYLISDNADTLVGMRLAGIDGELVHDAQSVEDAVNRCLAMKRSESFSSRARCVSCAAIS